MGFTAASKFTAAFMFALATAAAIAPTLARAESNFEVEAIAPQLTAAERLSDLIRASLAKTYSGARIELSGPIRWTIGKLIDSASDLTGFTIRNETARGEVVFAVTETSSGREVTGYVSFAAWVPARIAIKRVFPGQALTADSFKKQEINVASGIAREMRGVILEPETSVERLEARQTVLEGQFLTSTAVQRIPDIRRGDAVRVNLVSNGLSLSTQGMAQEPAYFDGQVRVTTGKAKRELVGRLMQGGIVEVKL